LITNEVLNATKRLIFLRNPIAHEYYKIKHEELKEMVELLERVKNFVEKAKEAGDNVRDGRL